MDAEYLVDRVLPEDMLLIQGKYIQTWAHIERTLFFICIMVKGVEFKSDQEINENLPVRKETKRLWDELEDAVSGLRDEKREHLQGVISTLKAEWINRHLAVHGAWFPGDGVENFKCEYFDNQGTKKSPEWRVYAAPITRVDISAAMSRANELLIMADDLCESLKRERHQRLGDGEMSRL